MSYFSEIDGWLEEILAGLPADDKAFAKKEIKDKILESYRNGQKTPYAGKQSGGAREPERGFRRKPSRR